MVGTVIFLVSRQVGDAEVGAQVDDLAAGGHQGLGKVRRGAVRQGQEPEVDVMAGGEGLGVGIAEFQLVGRSAAQRRDDGGDRPACVLTRCDRRQFDLRVTEEELDQNFAGVTRRADNADIHLMERQDYEFPRGNREVS